MKKIWQWRPAVGTDDDRWWQQLGLVAGDNNCRGEGI